MIAFVVERFALRLFGSFVGKRIDSLLLLSDDGEDDRRVGVGDVEGCDLRVNRRGRAQVAWMQLLLEESAAAEFEVLIDYGRGGAVGDAVEPEHVLMGQRRGRGYRGGHAD